MWKNTRGKARAASIFLFRERCPIWYIERTPGPEARTLGQGDGTCQEVSYHSAAQKKRGNRTNNEVP